MYISHTTIKQSARSMANDMTQTLTHSIPFFSTLWQISEKYILQQKQNLLKIGVRLNCEFVLDCEGLPSSWNTVGIVLLGGF